MGENKAASQQPDLRQDPYIIIPCTLILLLIVAVAIMNPEGAEAILKGIYGPFATHTGALYLWVTFGMIALSAYFVCSRYGDICFGEPDEKPEFTNGAWLALMFCSGVAGAVMFWSIVEPLWNIAAPPQYAEPLSRQAFDWSLSYVLLHWGPVTWPWYVIVALPICYMYHRLRKPVLRISGVAEPVIGKKATAGWAGRALEIFFIIGLLFSNTAVMGVSLPIVAEAFAALTGLENNFGLQLAILGVSAAIFTTSVSLGLKAGIKTLSYINAVIAVSMVTYAFLVGPSTQILNNFTNSMGMMVGNFFEMLFWTSPWQAESFPQDWTVFYALWMASYAPFMGLFIARISRGRTVRQVILMGIFGGIAGSYLIHGVFGTYTLNAQHTGLVDAVAILKASGGSAALIAVLQTLPLPQIILVGYCMFSTIFLATSVDSSAYIVACASTRKLTVGAEPSLFSRFFWAILQTALALAIICIGGLGVVKIFANFAGALMLAPIVIAIIAWFKFIKHHDIVEEEERLAKLEKKKALEDPLDYPDPEDVVDVPKTGLVRP
ncbi:BCCT family transporter [Desulfovibrio sp. OttesenSCG-928-G15]|nr:BCCT family transporter [Desulfovibrio sp. OttesenSCG-928-G15]